MQREVGIMGVKGSRKPILSVVGNSGAGPGAGLGIGIGSGEWENDLLPCRDGRELSAIEILIEVSGDYAVAAERIQSTEADFAIELAKCNPSSLALGMKAIHLLQISRMTHKIGSEIMDRLEDAKVGSLIGLYPKLVELIPALTDARVNVHASQTNTYNMNAGAGQIPENIRLALEALGLNIPGIPDIYDGAGVRDLGLVTED